VYNSAIFGLNGFVGLAWEMSFLLLSIGKIFSNISIKQLNGLSNYNSFFMLEHFV
jgi:hypothetical protein